MPPSILAALVRACLPLAVIALAVLSPAWAEDREAPRVALVVGIANDPFGPVPSAVNDAGLMVQSLQSAGFEVVQGADLDLQGLRRSIRTFLDRVEAAGPQADALVYWAGRGLQFEGETWFVPAGARIERGSDIPMEAVRIGDLVRSLAALPARSRILLLDAARAVPPLRDRQPLAPGLGLLDPPQGFAVGFSAAPDALLPETTTAYGNYASALVEMMREPGLGLDELLGRVRVRVHERSQGRQTPWNMVKLDQPFAFYAVRTDAGLPASETAPVQDRRIGELPPPEAYALALERDTIQAYQEFLRAYPRDPQAKRVQRLLLLRREAVVWQRTVARNTPDAYWTYLQRYPAGPHARDADRRLARLAAPVRPPAAFEEYEIDDLPPPLPEFERVDPRDWRGDVVEWDDPPPPPPPAYLIGGPPPDDVWLRPPPPPTSPGLLPILIPVPIPGWARRPPPPPPPVVIQVVPPPAPAGAVPLAGASAGPGQPPVPVPGGPPRAPPGPTPAAPVPPGGPVVPGRPPAGPVPPPPPSAASQPPGSAAAPPAPGQPLVSPGAGASVGGTAPLQGRRPPAGSRDRPAVVAPPAGSPARPLGGIAGPAAPEQPPQPAQGALPAPASPAPGPGLTPQKPPVTAGPPGPGSPVRPGDLPPLRPVPPPSEVIRPRVPSPSLAPVVRAPAAPRLPATPLVERPTRREMPRRLESPASVQAAPSRQAPPPLRASEPRPAPAAALSRPAPPPPAAMAPRPAPPPPVLAPRPPLPVQAQPHAPPAGGKPQGQGRTCGQGGQPCRPGG